MNFTDPQPLTDILGKLDSRTPIGSVLRSTDWQQVPAALRDRAVFSAGVESVRWLSEIDKGIKDIVGRARATNERGESYWKTDRSKIIADLRKLGQEIGIPHPDGARKDGKIRENDLRDPLSIRRLKLIVNTLMAMAQGYGDYLASQDPTVLEQWPAQELVRISPRANPRRWKERWVEAGGKLYDGRMIARKDSPIWVKISRFGNPYPPFDYESGMGVEDVDYDEAVRLGVIQEGDEVTSQVKTFNEGLESSVKNLTPKQQGWLKGVFGDQVEIKDGVAKWQGLQPESELPAMLQDPRIKPDMRPGAPVKNPAPGRGVLIDPDLPTVEESALINLKYEHAWSYDEKGNKLDVVQGDESSVSIPPRLLRPGYIISHNHPRGTAFSRADLHVTAENDLREMRVIGHQGDPRVYLYRFSFAPGLSLEQRRIIIRSYQVVEVAVRKEMEKAILKGEMTGPDVEREFRHAIMTRLKEELPDQINYARIQLS